jgi:cytochrome P450 family 3 subfamily A
MNSLRFVNRRCTKATVVKGIQIPEDMTVVVDVLSIHYNPEYWGSVDPNEFYPLRLLLETFLEHTFKNLRI